MADPFSELKSALQSVFHLEQKRNGKYIYSEITQLKRAIENYNPEHVESFKNLHQAVRAALPHIEKWDIHFDSIKNSLDALVKNHHLPKIDWDQFLSHPKVSQQFQFNVLNRSQQSTELIPWLLAQANNQTTLSADKPIEILVATIGVTGFSQKIKEHLHKDPDFLSRLIMESENNFSSIAKTRLVLYLTDEQIANAVIKHSPNLIQKHENPFAQVEQLVEKINGTLSTGRSISTLLRNTEAKNILEKSEVFRIYQSDEYKNWLEQKAQAPSSPGGRGFSPGF